MGSLWIKTLIAATLVWLPYCRSVPTASDTKDYSRKECSCSAQWSCEDLPNLTPIRPVYSSATFSYRESCLADLYATLNQATKLCREFHFNIGFRSELHQLGFRVTQVFAEATAAAVGILVGDIIMKVNGQPYLYGRVMENMKSISRARGEDLVLSILRNRESITIHLPQHERGE